MQKFFVILDESMFGFVCCERERKKERSEAHLSLFFRWKEFFSEEEQSNKNCICVLEKKMKEGDLAVVGHLGQRVAGVRCWKVWNSLKKVVKWGWSWTGHWVFLWSRGHSCSVARASLQSSQDRRTLLAGTRLIPGHRRGIRKNPSLAIFETKLEINERFMKKLKEN